MNDHTEPLQPLSTPSVPIPPPAHTAFTGRFGLRAGWSIAIFIASFTVLITMATFALLAATGQLKHRMAEKQPSAPHQTMPSAEKNVKPRFVILNDGASFVCILAATSILALIERRRLRVYGINRRDILDVLPGAFWGLASLSLLVLALHACHVLVFDSRLLYGSLAWLYGAKWLLAFLFVGLFEEYLNRGFLQYTFTRGLYGLAGKISHTHAKTVAFWLAALLMSVLFGASHLGNKGETAAGILMVFVAGIVFSYALWRTGSLWWAIGFHITWDWAQSFLWGVPDSGQTSAGRLFQTHPTGSMWLSGGPDGPEGSILVLPTLLLVALVIRFTTQQRPQPPLEQDVMKLATAPALA